MYYVTMQITLYPFQNLRVTNVIFIVMYYTLPPIESSPSFWMTRSQRSRRRDKGLWSALRRMPLKLKGKVYRIVVMQAMMYGAEIWGTNTMIKKEKRSEET